jgi:hypothetical protein
LVDEGVLGSADNDGDDLAGAAEGVGWVAVRKREVYVEKTGTYI